MVTAENSANEDTNKTDSISVAPADPINEDLIATNDTIQDQQIAVVAVNDSNIQAQTITIVATDDYNVDSNAARHINDGQRIVILSSNKINSDLLGTNNAFGDTNYRQKINLSKPADNIAGGKRCLEDNQNMGIVISAIQESDIDDQLFNTFIDADIDGDILNASDTNANEYCRDNQFDNDHIIGTQSIETMDTLMDRDSGDETFIQKKSIENIALFSSNVTITTTPILEASQDIKSNDGALPDISPEPELADRVTTKEIIDSFEIQTAESEFADFD